MDKENKEETTEEKAPKILYGFAVSIIEGNNEPNIEVFGETTSTELTGLAQHASARFETMRNDEMTRMLYMLKQSADTISERQNMSAEATQAVMALLGRMMASEPPVNTNLSDSPEPADISTKE